MYETGIPRQTSNNFTFLVWALAWTQILNKRYWVVSTIQHLNTKGLQISCKVMLSINLINFKKSFTVYISSLFFYKHIIY